MFSKACQYAIKATIYIAQQTLSGQSVSVKEIAHSIGAPEAFTAKTLQLLSKNGLVGSSRGKQGGFFVSEEQLDRVKIFDIIKIVDGDSLFIQCGLGLKECSSTNPCPVHEEFKLVRSGIISMAQKYSLRELAFHTEQGIFRLKA